MAKWLIFSNLVVAKTLDYNEDQSTWPAERDLRAAPFPRSKFTQRKFDWVAFNTCLASRTEGHLRAIAMDPCYIPKSGKHGCQHRQGLRNGEPLGRGCQAPHPQHGNGPTNIINVRKNTELELKSGNFQRTIVLWRKIRRLIIKILTNYWSMDFDGFDQ